MTESELKSYLRVLNGVEAGRSHELTGTRIVLGRNDTCEIVLRSQAISRQHAKIERRLDGYYLEDLQSLNGTYVNGQRLEGSQRLRDGNCIQIHDVLLQYVECTEEPSSADNYLADFPHPVEPKAARSTSIVQAIDVWHGSGETLQANSQTKLTALLEIMHSVGSSLDIDATLPRVLDGLFHIFPQVDRGVVLLAEGPAGKLVPRAVKFRDTDGEGSQTLGPMSYHWARQAIEQRKAVLGAEGGAEGGSPRETIFGEEFRAVMAAPLMTPTGQPSGAIQLTADDPKQRLTPEDLDVLAHVAALVGLLVDHARWHERKRAEEALAREHAITERERRRLQAVLEILPVGVCIVDKRGRIIESNAEAAKIWGGEIPKGLPLEDYGQVFKAWWPDNGQRVQSHEWGMARALRAGEVCAAEEMLIETFDGRRLTILSYALPIVDSAGRLQGGVAVYVDITQRKQDEEALREADRRKDEFLAMLAHELRNPLAPISNALVLLRSEESETVQPFNRWALDLMERQVEHLVRLVDDLLDVSRIMRGKIQLRIEPVELKGIIDRAVETVRPLMHSQEHQLHVSIPNQPIWVMADSVRLAQVLSNLLNNASKYTPKGGCIWLDCRLELDHAVLRVRDNGVGIAPEVLPHIFDLFTQADRSLDRSQGGLGIGLSLVERLVRMHNGSVQAHSGGLGQGSEFVVRIPACSPQAARQTPQRFVPATLPAKRVLVVDDHVGQAQILARMLERFWGHEVQTAHNGPSAIAAALEFHPDLILLDIGLPGMSGYEVARQLRQQPELSHVLLVALSGYGQDEDRRQSMEAGFDKHLVKPASVEVLQELFTHPKLLATV